MGRGISLASNFQPDFGLPYPRGWEKEFAALSDDDLIALAGVKAALAGGVSVDVTSLPPQIHRLATKLIVERNAQDDPIQYGWTLEKWIDLQEAWKFYTSFFVFGGNRCLVGTEEFTIKSGEKRRIDSIQEPIWVWAFSESEKGDVAVKGGTPFSKGQAECVRVFLSNAQMVECSIDHQFMGEDGLWYPARALRVGTQLKYRPDGREHLWVSKIEPIGLHEVWDFNVPEHHNYWHKGCLHHNSSKSVFAARLVVWCLMNIPEARVRCWQVNDEKSVSEQQAYIWEALPSRYKNLGRKRGAVHAIEYSQKNGFTGNKLILPPLKGCDRGGECLFGTYQQYRNDPQVVEGWWAHLIWCDEEMEQKMYDRLLYRVKDADGRILNTFTTIKGWTPLVEDVIGKTRTLKRRRATLLNRDLPTAQESIKRPKTRIDYFWTEDNPFLPPNTMDSFVGRPENEVKATAYGIPTKAATAVLSLFDMDVHVIPEEKLPWNLWEKQQREADAAGNPWAQQAPPHFTRYLINDPAGDKPWFMIWGAVDALKRKYVYREWPDESYGAWGESGPNPDGLPGPAQRRNEFGIDDYVQMINHAESGEEIFERIIDPRLANTPQHTRDGATTIQTELDASGMTFMAAPGNNIHHGLDLIKSALQWDKTKELSPMNSPKLYISDRCQNLIEALKNYSNYSAREVWKDPVDCLRMWLEAGADYVPPEAMKSDNRTFSY